MKCIKKGKIIRRVSNNEAARMVNQGEWKYTSKSVWKKEVRNKEK